MKSDNQNQFYTSISKYYSHIFPYNPAQLQFVKSRVGELTGKIILDIGCATGELSFQLAKSGAKVTGIDLNEELLSQANGCNRFQSAGIFERESEIMSPNPTFQTGNMLDLKADFQPAHFDAVLCFGNTLVHLENKAQVQQMVDGVFSVLKSGGIFLIQILNYDYILDEQVSELPLIETEDIKFVRNYKFENQSLHVLFQTNLFLKNENEIISNETKLLALKSSEMFELLNETGFTDIEFFAGFNQTQFGGKHLPFVVSCKK
jgi:glycine/sarcosine N-methyltransferase